jgi:hypothetical protein
MFSKQVNYVLKKKRTIFSNQNLKLLSKLENYEMLSLASYRKNVTTLQPNVIKQKWNVCLHMVGKTGILSPKYAWSFLNVRWWVANAEALAVFISAQIMQSY